MTTEHLEPVREVVESEGFGYAFLDYSSFSSIKDDEFHRLRKAFVEAGQALRDYIEAEGT